VWIIQWHNPNQGSQGRMHDAEQRYRKFIPNAWIGRKHFYEELAAVNAVEQKPQKKKYSSES